MEALRFIYGISGPFIAFGLSKQQHHYPPSVHIATVALHESGSIANERSRGSNWVSKFLRMGSSWEEWRKQHLAQDAEDEGDGCVRCGEADGIEGFSAEKDEGGVEFDRDSFSRFLHQVPLSEAELFAKMSYLGKLAYSIPKIKPVSLLKNHGLHYVTSSLEKKAILSCAEKPTPNQDKSSLEPTIMNGNSNYQGKSASGINVSAAYRIAASAVTYLQSQTRNIISQNTRKTESDDLSFSTCSNEDKNASSRSQMASFVATTNSVTAVIVGEEGMKDAVAEGLNSASFSPCQWFICDDDKSGTRYFVIQGSESLASWQTNLLFEPIQFEGLDVFVHRGIYEAARGIYQQMLAEVQAHIKHYGDSATLRFTGHSLGGSLAILVNLMLSVRGDAPPSSLLPVITFGAPSIMCRGDYLLRRLGLPRSHVQSIMLHRDIVPRAFSCHYPHQVAKILKAVNRNFRKHPCLNNHSRLYAPMGKLLILQPEEAYSPHHHLLPPGSGLYLMSLSFEETEESMKLLQSAQHAFLNTPHPLEILSDRLAYGPEGTIFRDHDMNSYLKSIHGVIEMELRHVKEAESLRRRLIQWPGLISSSSAASLDIGKHLISISGTLNWLAGTFSRQIWVVIMFLENLSIARLG